MINALGMATVKVVATTVHFCAVAWSFALQNFSGNRVRDWKGGRRPKPGAFFFVFLPLGARTSKAIAVALESPTPGRAAP